MPKLEHPDSDQPIESLPESVDIYRTQGWQEEGSGKPPKKTRTRKTPVTTKATGK